MYALPGEQIHQHLLYHHRNITEVELERNEWATEQLKTYMNNHQTHASENLTTTFFVGISACFATSLFVIALIIADATSFLTLSFRQAFMMMCDEKLVMDDTRDQEVRVVRIIPFT